MIFVALEHYFLIACSLLHEWHGKVSSNEGLEHLNTYVHFPVEYGSLPNKSRSIGRIKIWKCVCYWCNPFSWGSSEFLGKYILFENAKWMWILPNLLSQLFLYFWSGKWVSNISSYKLSHICAKKPVLFTGYCLYTSF